MMIRKMEAEVDVEEEGVSWRGSVICYLKHCRQAFSLAECAKAYTTLNNQLSTISHNESIQSVDF